MTKEEIGQALKKAKGEKTYYRLQKETGMPQHQIKNIENGENYTIDSLLKYAKAVNLNLTLINAQPS